MADTIDSMDEPAADRLPRTFAESQARKEAERRQIRAELLAAGDDEAARRQVILEHDPFASLQPGQVRIRLDLAKRLV